MFAGLITILGGILIASSYLINKKPDIKPYIEKLAPYQNWIGVLIFALGIIETLNTVISSNFTSMHFMKWVFELITGITNLAVGFILGFSLLSQYLLSKNEVAEKKGKELQTKLSKNQISLGLFTILIGILSILI